jgi:hypothetical protein
MALTREDEYVFSSCVSWVTPTLDRGRRGHSGLALKEAL